MFSFGLNRVSRLRHLNIWLIFVSYSRIQKLFSKKLTKASRYLFDVL